MQQIALILPIMLLLSVCGPLDQLMGSQTAPQHTPTITPPPPSPPPSNETPQNATPSPVVTPPPAPVTPPPPNATAPNAAQDLQTWNAINTNSVQTICLPLAKSQTGMYSSMQKCVCDENLANGVKNYDCTISTTSGGIPLRVYCKQANRGCTWVSGTLNGSLTFDQIRQLLAQNGG